MDGHPIFWVVDVSVASIHHDANVMDVYEWNLPWLNGNYLESVFFFKFYNRVNHKLSSYLFSDPNWECFASEIKVRELLSSTIDMFIFLRIETNPDVIPVTWKIGKSDHILMVFFITECDTGL